uniref:Uncharacterized protein n=1 Tax=Timema cristinae TaxID=61476 RepID=A0A7R9D906_TIMCR|nr:unnamed protein product [Timema cristinae]
MLIHFRLLSRPSSYLIYVRSIRTKFNKAFGKYLYLTNTITCGVLMGAGDIVQQKIETYNSLKKDSKFDWHRSACSKSTQGCRLFRHSLRDNSEQPSSRNCCASTVQVRYLVTVPRPIAENHTPWTPDFETCELTRKSQAVLKQS